MTKVLGLTGGIGSGKTTISNYFRSLDIPVIDADIVARQVIRAGEPVVKEIAQVFGSDILLADGEINRGFLSEQIFASEEKRKELDRIVQPPIRKAIKKERDHQLAKHPRLIVLDIPLLYEEGYETEVDQVMVVYVDPTTQKERLLKRDRYLTEQGARNRIQSQMSLSEKAKKADIVIDNNGTIEESIQQVNDWLKASFSSNILSI